MKPLTCLLSVCVLLAVAASVHAQPQFDPAARAKAIAPFVEENTIAIVHVDLSRIDPQSLFDMIARFIPVPPMAKKDIVKWCSATLQAGAKEFYYVAPSTGLIPNPLIVLVIPLPAGADPEAFCKALDISADQVQTIHGALVLMCNGHGPQKGIKTMRFQPVERPELLSAFEAAGDTAAQAILIPPRDSRRVIEELMPEFPKELGGGSTSVLTRGVSWAAVGVDLPPRTALRLAVQSPDAKAAEALQAKLAEMMRLAGQRKEVRKYVPKFDELSALLAPKVEDNRLVLALNEENQGVQKCIAALAPPVEALQASNARYESMNNMKMLGLAMHVYYEKNKHLPLPASRGPDGKPLLSWRVHILPFLEGEALYKQFHLDEPWDSEHNRKLIDKMPSIYRLPISKSGAGRTNYLLPVGNGAAFDADKPVKFEDIPDGTSATIMVVVVDDQHAAVWTKPDDLQFDPKEPAKGLGQFFNGGFLATICDGSVRLMKWPKTPKEIKNLKRMFLRADGEIVE
jgi:hypothetical protein